MAAIPTILDRVSKPFVAYYSLLALSEPMAALPILIAMRTINTVARHWQYYGNKPTYPITSRLLIDCLQLALTIGFATLLPANLFIGMFYIIASNMLEFLVLKYGLGYDEKHFPTCDLTIGSLKYAKYASLSFAVLGLLQSNVFWFGMSATLSSLALRNSLHVVESEKTRCKARHMAYLCYTVLLLIIDDLKDIDLLFFTQLSTLSHLIELSLESYYQMKSGHTDSYRDESVLFPKPTPN